VTLAMVTCAISARIGAISNTEAPELSLHTTQAYEH